ncbi:MAG: calcium/sodium antiporter [Henriciella sp.]|nr:calcium/sodium antiporter [Henriciella sp.]
MMMIILILSGFVLLFAGGEALVRGSVGVARKFGMSELVIGLTLVGFGTSLPELVTSLQALSEGAVGLAVGNVVGSNIANILLVLGVAALVAPILTSPRALARDGVVMLVATLLFAALLWFDMFTRTAGILMVALLLVYLVLSVVLDRRSDSAAGSMHQGEAEEFGTDDPLWLAALLAIGGIAGVVIGARFLVDGGTDAAVALGVSDTVIGISVLAIGTSLPELATSVMAVRNGKADVALGNIIGSNIFNVLGIMGISAIVMPFSISAVTERFGDLSTNAAGAMQAPAQVMEAVSLVTWTDMGALALSVFLLGLFAYTGRKLARWEGFILLASYVIYLGIRFNLIPVISFGA